MTKQSGAPPPRTSRRSASQSIFRFPIPASARLFNRGGSANLFRRRRHRPPTGFAKARLNRENTSLYALPPTLDPIDRFTPQGDKPWPSQPRPTNTHTWTTKENMSSAVPLRDGFLPTSTGTPHAPNAARTQAIVAKPPKERRQPLRTTKGFAHTRQALFPAQPAPPPNPKPKFNQSIRGRPQAITLTRPMANPIAPSATIFCHRRRQ